MKFEDPDNLAAQLFCIQQLPDYGPPNPDRSWLNDFWASYIHDRYLLSLLPHTMQEELRAEKLRKERLIFLGWDTTYNRNRSTS